MTVLLVHKYTGTAVSDDALAAARHHGGPLGMTAAAIADGCEALASTEADLADLVEAIAEHLTTVRCNLTAASGEAVPSVNPLGVLQAHGPRLDALISRRATQIHHLRALVRLWLTHHRQFAPTDPAEQVRQFADRVLAAIDDDIAEGIVPAGIGSFTDLHRYLDAND